MNYWESKYQQVSKQRIVISLLLILMTLANTSLVVSMLKQKQQVILVPVVEQQLVVGGREYLEALANSLASLILNLSPSNIDLKKDQLAKYMPSSAYQEVAEYFAKQREKIKKLDISTTFDIKEMKSDQTELRVAVKGILSTWVSSSNKEEDKIICILNFSSVAGKLILKNFQIAKEE